MVVGGEFLDGFIIFEITIVYASKKWCAHIVLGFDEVDEVGFGGSADCLADGPALPVEVPSGPICGGGAVVGGVPDAPLVVNGVPVCRRVECVPDKSVRAAAYRIEPSRMGGWIC